VRIVESSVAAHWWQELRCLLNAEQPACLYPAAFEAFCAALCWLMLCCVANCSYAGKKQAVVAGVVEGSAAEQRRKVAGLNRILDKESVKDGAYSCV
jgi:hypothetical protein